jgi:hypothetical protein
MASCQVDDRAKIGMLEEMRHFEVAPIRIDSGE